MLLTTSIAGFKVLNCIHVPGKEMKEDLVQMLQKRLDDAVLEKLCEMLRRNPQCQLDKHDVQVSIQGNLEIKTSSGQLKISSCI